MGVLVAIALVSMLRRLEPAGVPRLDSIHVDGPVLLFALGMVAVTALGAGLWPAFRAARPASPPPLEGGSGPSGKPEARRGVAAVVRFGNGDRARAADRSEPAGAQPAEPRQHRHGRRPGQRHDGDARSDVRTPSPGRPGGRSHGAGRRRRGHHSGRPHGGRRRQPAAQRRRRRGYAATGERGQRGLSRHRRAGHPGLLRGVADPAGEGALVRPSRRPRRSSGGHPERGRRAELLRRWRGSARADRHAAGAPRWGCRKRGDDGGRHRGEREVLGAGRSSRRYHLSPVRPAALVAGVPGGSS